MSHYHVRPSDDGKTWYIDRYDARGRWWPCCGGFSREMALRRVANFRNNERRRANAAARKERG